MAPRGLAQRVSAAHSRLWGPAGPHRADDGPAAQISAGGKTTSLGDHDTEEDAARAFDRAAINKQGLAARTNFDVTDYMDEVEDLQSEWVLAPSWYVWPGLGLLRAVHGPGAQPLRWFGRQLDETLEHRAGASAMPEGSRSHRDGGLAR